ncbi:MAG: hypothetical protein R3E12_08565 [Candidatus Eisenbacteria bacterium]
MGDRLIVGLNSDRSTRALKGGSRPFVGERARAILLLALRAVDYVCLFDEPTPEALIRAVAPDVLCKGGDYRSEDIVGRDFVLGRGGRVEVIPFVSGFSTTQLVSRIRGGD